MFLSPIFTLVTLDYAFHFPDKGVDDVVKTSGMRSLTAFTVCLWMSSGATQGSPFSYAVSDEDNELLIMYNSYFELDIGGEQRLCRYFQTSRINILMINIIICCQ